ncbi:hypothetical protein RDI58_029011 [Solanum bulbocastanum]
MNFLK